MLWFSLTASFALMGVGLAAFQGGLNISGAVGTANTGARFVNNPNISEKALAERIKEEDEDESDSDGSGGMDHDTTVVTEDKPEPEPEGGNQEPVINATLGSDNKAISISIDNAYPGDVYRLQYQVENTGSIPLELSLSDERDEQNLSIDNSFEDNKLNPQEMTSGELEIKVDGNKEDLTSGTEEYGISVKLSYEQWNVD